MASVCLQLQNISKAFGDEEILNEVSLQIYEGDCIGLIGPNGAGKSTLFRIIVGLEHADTGEVVIPRSVCVGYLVQDSEAASDSTVLESMLASREDITAASTRMHALEAAMAAPGAHEDAQAFDRLLHEHARLAEEYHRLGGDRLEADARRILRGLGLEEALDTAAVCTLSGGQKRRLELGKLLLASPDLLLLDEPTNHLDLAAISWLEEYLRAYRGGVLIVSHDRYLLDRVANHMAEIEETRLRQYDGNYTQYQEKKRAEDALMLKRAESIARERARLQESVQRLFSFRQFTRMRSVQKRLYKLESITLPGETEKSRMIFKPRRQSGREVLTVQDVHKRYGDAPLIEGCSFTLWRGDRAAVIGPNGCGKTTLLRLLVGEMLPQAGDFTFGHQVQWYYYDQEGRNLDQSGSVLQAMVQLAPHASTGEVRSALARFLIFGEDVERRVSTLSGGERSRVALAGMFLSGANLLILDEPTNHLDIDGKEALEEALSDYPGTVLMVSHDRYFIDRVANRVLSWEAGRVRDYLGNYTEYLAKVNAPPPVSVDSRSPAKPVAPAPPKRRSLQFLQRRHDELEAEIARLELQKDELEVLLAQPDLYADGLRAVRATEEHQRTLDALQAAYTEWEALGEEIIALELEAEIARQQRLSQR
jgi:ATP-binding cassette subfamily F protein 3